VIAFPTNGLATPGSAVDLPRPTPTLGFNMRAKVIGPEVIDPIARVLQVLYTPPVLLAVLTAVALAHVWFYFFHGASASTVDLLYRPWALPIVLALMIVAGAFHEFGHAAALHYGGGQLRGMGVGIYLVYPAFYTDVTDSYRLGRWARVRTDLGGFYFYLIFALAMVGLYFLTGQEFLLVIILLINLDILYQLLPFVRMDGYWALADLTGIPDFLSMAGPFLASILPLRGWQGSRLPPLKPWVKLVFAVYLLLTIPLLVLGLTWMVLRLPRFLLLFWDSLLYQVQVFSLARSNGDLSHMILLVVSMLLVALMMVGSLYLVFNLGRTSVKALWHWSTPTPRRRISGAVLACAVLSLIGYSWIPSLSLLTRKAPADVQSFAVPSRDHVSGAVAYPQSPPVGGDHAPLWQNCGFYDTVIAPEHAVHSLEHGAVWLTYRPDLPTKQLNLLRQLASRQTYVLASPNPDQTASVIASAWGKQLTLDSVPDPQVEQFIRAFRLGTQAPERGGGCTGGIGVPK
jgi:hypothetical protein